MPGPPPSASPRPARPGAARLHPGRPEAGRLRARPLRAGGRGLPGGGGAARGPAAGGGGPGPGPGAPAGRAGAGVRAAGRDHRREAAEQLEVLDRPAAAGPGPAHRRRALGAGRWVRRGPGAARDGGAGLPDSGSGLRRRPAAAVHRHLHLPNPGQERAQAGRRVRGGERPGPHRRRHERQDDAGGPHRVAGGGVG